MRTPLEDSNMPLWVKTLHLVPDIVARFRVAMEVPERGIQPFPDETLDEYIAAQGIEHFTGVETLQLRRIGVEAPSPPKNMWSRIIPTLRLAQELRHRLGHPLVVGNGYRPKKLNKQVGGARNSQHIHYRALDLDLPMDHRKPSERRRFYEEAADIYLTWGDEMRVGFGIYSKHSGTRIHLDTGFRKRTWGPGMAKLLKDVR